MAGKKSDTDVEKQIWNLMVKDFYWSEKSLSNIGVGLQYRKKRHTEKIKLQLFEVVVAAVFSSLRSDYDWWVTPNMPDGGVDFVGRGVFLSSKEFEIDAAITIGGQCKKRERVSDVVAELSGSFVRMAQSLSPTLFVAAFSAPLTVKRVRAAKEILESTLQRHCHILDRKQLECMISANINVAKSVIQVALAQEDANSVFRYFRNLQSKVSITIKIYAPESTLSGEPFRVRLKISKSSIFKTIHAIRWMPSFEPSYVSLIAPLGMEGQQAFPLKTSNDLTNDPFSMDLDLEFVSYAIGTQNLGSVSIFSVENLAEPTSITQLPSVNIIENLRPPFYDAPYQSAMEEIQKGIQHANTGRVTCIAVSGAGGAGKTRLCEEMSLEARRHGAQVISARQAHTMEYPRRILANLLFDLTEVDLPNQRSIECIENILTQIEPNLAKRARPAIEALCGSAGKIGSFKDDQALLSVFLVLITKRSRIRTVLIHLHDLHWCTTDVLEIIDKLIWQLGHLKIQITPNHPPSGLRVIFLLEGRLHEYREVAETGWTTRMYESFIHRLECPIAQCRAFEPKESSEFVQRLFEQAHNAQRQLPRALLRLQQELINTIKQSAAGNPFHILEQIKLLQQHKIVAQNPATGFVYMVQPDFSKVSFPPNVFETIEARWKYYWHTEKEIAVLLWAAALVDDNLPPQLFRFLWIQLAQAVPQAKLESTEFFLLPHCSEEHFNVSFRHENYFRTMRRIQLPEKERIEVVRAYTGWFKSAKKLSPGLKYVQAKVELESCNPDYKNAKRILQSAKLKAMKRQDHNLVARIIVTMLDEIIWPSNQFKPLPIRTLINAIDEEESLCNILARSGQTEVVYERLDRILKIITSRLTTTRYIPKTFDSIVKRKFIFLAMKADILSHDRRPGEALEITDEIVSDLEALVDGLPSDEYKFWSSVRMKVLHIHSATVAFTGDLKRAVNEAHKAAFLAESLLETDPQSLNVVITSANILLCETPEESEQTLNNYLAYAQQSFIEEGTRIRLTINLSMARILIGFQNTKVNGKECYRLKTAHRDLQDVFRQAHPLGRLKDAAAAALLLGLIYAIRGDSDEIKWFSQATALAIRSRQMETLWRAYINLAHSLDRDGQSAHDPARAALEIMIYSLNYYSKPDQNPRFNLLAVPMAHAVRYLLLAEDKIANEVLIKFPALQGIFEKPELGQLKEDRDKRTSHEWFRIGQADYVLY